MKNVKRVYEAPNVEVIFFTTEDIMQESGVNPPENYTLSYGGNAAGAVTYDLLK